MDADGSGAVGYRGAVDAAAGLTAHLHRLEEELLRPEVRRSRAALEALLAPDFTEIGRSGRAYDREAIIAALAAEERGPIRVEDFAVRILAPGVALATYRSVGETPAGDVVALRASIWRHEADGAWRMTYHQGTPAG
jgi:hypothetical protein